MPSKNKSDFNTKGSYAKYMIEEEQKTRKDLFSDDDLGFEDLDFREQEVKNAPAAGSIREKMELLRKAAEERRVAKESLPEIETEFDGKLKAKTGRRKGVLALGTAICIFAVIGFITVLYLIGSGISTIVKNNSRLLRYDDIIAPVVYFDPAPFETFESLDIETSVYICLWETLKNNADNYSINENGKTVVPVADVDATAVRLFGSNVRLDYSLFEGNEKDIDYIAQENILEVFNTGIDGFTHKTLKIKKNGDQKEVVVGYIDPLADTEASVENTEVYSKKMVYIVKKDDATKKYYISAVREYTE